MLQEISKCYKSNISAFFSFPSFRIAQVPPSKNGLAKNRQSFFPFGSCPIRSLRKGKQPQKNVLTSNSNKTKIKKGKNHVRKHHKLNPSLAKRLLHDYGQHRYRCPSTLAADAQRHIIRIKTTLIY